jgi:hypothetical protein
MRGHFAVKVLTLIFLVASVTAAQSAPAPAQKTPRPVQSIPAIARAANGAIVTIFMADNDKPIAQGTGFLVSPDGVIVTNYHVIETGNVAAVKFPDGTILPVDGVLATDKVRDLAIIKIHGKTFRTLTLGNSDQIQIGEEVVAIGNPLSLESTVSNGIVSGRRTSKEQGGKFLQTTAPISPGSSGGPLFNMLGEVVGINTMYLEGGENLNFAIPINDAKQLLDIKYSKIQGLPNGIDPKETHGAHAITSQQKACDEETNKVADYIHIGDLGLLKWAYANNYDVTTSKCFVLIFSKPTIPTVPGHYYSISDASFLGDQGPNYGWCSLQENGTIDLGNLGGCFISPDGSPDKKINCQSEEEFNELGLKYFGVDVKSIHTYVYDEKSDEVSSESNTPNISASPKPARAESTTNPARNYYQQLFDAGGFSHGLPNGVCFSDDAQSGTFFTFVAYAFDKDYYDAQAKLTTLDMQARAAGLQNVTQEEMTQLNIMERVQRTASYVTYLMKVVLESFPPNAQQFFRSGGRILWEDVYEKGVKTDTLEYLWDGSSWFLSIPPTDPNAYSRTTRILHLSIEPTTMRYAESSTVTITVGKGDTAATGTDRYGPWAGVCEKVPNPK